jgi:hypothetical protein
VAQTALKDKSKIHLLSLYIKVRLIQIPVNVTGKESEGLTVEANIFPEYVKPRRKIEFFIGPPITQLFEDQEFNTELNPTNTRAWNTFEEAFRNIPGNKKS